VEPLVAAQHFHEEGWVISGVGGGADDGADVFGQAFAAESGRGGEDGCVRWLDPGVKEPAGCQNTALPLICSDVLPSASAVSQDDHLCLFACFT
jgi:hypothetical protein